jgi:hypothetical protein
MNRVAICADDLQGESASPEATRRFVVDAAMQAPSVHDTKPWWFYGIGHELGIHADVERRLPIADPDGREMLIGCGAAVFTARVALRYLGFVPEVDVLPDPGQPDLVARITWTEGAPPGDYEQKLFAEVAQRRTHRLQAGIRSLPAGLLPALGGEVSKENAKLQIIGEENQWAALAAVTQAGDYALRCDAARVLEATSTLEHGWGLPPLRDGRASRPTGVVALLTTELDSRTDWISAGQGLQRVLLAAGTCGLATSLHSQPLEIAELRDFIRNRICDGAFPQMVLNFGAAERSPARDLGHMPAATDAPS